MRILLVNDDGIDAPGIKALCEAVHDAGHTVLVCAPNLEKSAAGHAISLKAALTPFRVPFTFAEEAYAVNGTPADCARLGLYLFKDIDLVISGINNGSNLGGACIYSGTVGAAMEASMSGVPAFAVSRLGYNREDYSTAARVAERFAEWAVRHPLDRGRIYNVNVPDCPYEMLGDYRLATLAPTYLDAPAYSVEDAGEQQHFFYAKEKEEESFAPDCDVMIAHQGNIPVTVLTWDLRAVEANPDLSALNNNALPDSHREIERKYLIAMPNRDELARQFDCEIWEIRQTYLVSHKGCTRRVRAITREGKTAYIKTTKRRISGMTAEEDEARIDESTYRVMLEEADESLQPIIKTRYRIPYRGQILEFDLYPFWSDRAILEIELEDESQPTIIPKSVKIYKDVTEDYRYKNVCLAASIPMDDLKGTV